jgi:molecular chaperone DnaK
MGKVVGIDLGTTNSVVAVMEGGKPVVIANADGVRTTPSFVGFSKDGERLVGEMARRQAELNPKNTYYGVKRFMGRKYSELSAQSKQVPYTIRKDGDGNVRIDCPRQNRNYAPEEVSAMILQKLIDDASRYIGEDVKAAVITVPAYFNDSQRQATRDAGRIAGLEVLRIVNEPTAAALAYGFDKNQDEIILVFDLGGGTFDVSVLEISDNVFQVLATSGDTQLGGADFDKRIVDWLATEFLAAENIDLRKERQSLQRLTEAAEKAKKELSSMMVTDIIIPFITVTPEGPKNLEMRLTRAQFEEICGDLLTRLQAPVQRALKDADLSPEEIDEVVLVGGSSRIPAVQELVKSTFKRRPSQNVNPEEVVAVGAAIQASLLGGTAESNNLRDMLLVDVTPLSLGLETIGGVMKKLIPRNSTIPTRKSDIFSTSENNQTVVEIHIVQGEREMAADNKSLGKFKLSGIPPAPKGMAQIQVSFDIDANGILQVTAMDRTTGREQTVTTQNASNLGEKEIQRAVEEAKQFAAIDKQQREKVDKRNRAESITYQAERQLREVALDYGMQFASRERKKIEGLVRELRAALAANDERGIDEVKTELDNAIYDLTRLVRQIAGDEDKGILGTLKEIFVGDDDDYYDYRDPYARDAYYGNYGNRPNDYPALYPSDRNYDVGRGSSNYNDDRYNNNRPDRRYDGNDWDDNRNDWNDSRRDNRDNRPSDSIDRRPPQIRNLDDDDRRDNWDDGRGTGKKYNPRTSDENASRNPRSNPPTYRRSDEWDDEDEDFY